ncbi:response regulator [uncultured Ferrovibrio sp.]|jgi:two-component system chemotaxis response regulator CheY|uniref:response regulator n=1 Tax=uncultured Ferrovibrio sp. TaxID=1576913 RepID=UPI0026060E06|nr:response regulator [uncultured Ferrovibrio sp.]
MVYDLSQIHVLVVDQDDHVTSTWRWLLEGLGVARWQHVPDAAAAWKVLCAHGIRSGRDRVDALICRWELPAAEGDLSDGLDLIRRLRNEPASPNPFLPAIIVTATITRERVREALDAGVNELLVLPLSAKSLEIRLREVIDKPRKFVRGGGYFGPDRRRFTRPDYPGPFRRAEDAEE